MAQKGKLTLTNMIYGLGAAIVLLGALFKIQHWPFGSEILTLGMIVEALVFAYSAFERQQADLDWSLVYPELAGGATAGKKKKEDFIIVIDDKYTSDPKKFGMDEIVIMNPEKKAKGGRVGLKSGSKGCKLAMKGKGRAYGKNS